jgi:hypothetical protein
VMSLFYYYFMFSMYMYTYIYCACGHERETPEHVTIFCPLHQDTREQLRVNGRFDFDTLVTTVGGG